MKVDWNDKESVIAYAKHLAGTAASDVLVFKHPSRSDGRVRTYTIVWRE